MGKDTEDKRLNFTQNFVAGGIAGAGGRTFTAPLNVIKIQSQVGTRQARQGFFWTAAHIYKNEGKIGFWKGNLTACARLFPFTAIQFSVYNYCKEPFVNKRGVLHPIGAYIAGSTGGVVATFATYPLDVIKTRLTVQGGVVCPKHYSGVINAIYLIFKEEGFFALYKGIFPSVIGIIPLTGALFMTYEVLDRLLTRTNRETHPAIHFFNGIMAAGVSQFFAYPFDTVRKKLQVQTHVLPSVGVLEFQFSGMVDCFNQIYIKNGILGFWSGYFANYMKVLPYVGFMFMSYELTKKLFLQANGY